MAKIDDWLRSVGLHELAKDEPQKLNTDDSGVFVGEEGQAIPIETARIVRGRPRVLVGPRGRDPGGYPKLIPVGVPPAVSGEPKRIEVPKDMEIPPRPPRYDQEIAISITANSGDIIDKEVAFPVRSIQLDNYSHVWLYVDGIQRWIPPGTIGWCFPVLRAQSKIHIAASAPPNATQGAAATGDFLNVLVSERIIDYSPGVSIGLTTPVVSAIVSGNQTPGDAVVNPSDAVDVRAFLEGWTGAAWSRPIILFAGGGDTNASQLGWVVQSYGLVYNGASFDRIRTPAIFKTAIATALGNTAVWTPAAGKKFRLMAYSIEVTSNASLAAGAVEEITLNDSGTAIGQGCSVFVPTAAGALIGNIQASGGMRQLGNGFLSGAANNVLQVNLGTALATGEVRVNVIGTEE